MANAHEGVHGHIVDQVRDEARRDRSYTRSSANITPATFAGQLSRRRFNESTARVEEIPEDEVQVKPKSRFPPATASTPLTVNVQQPSVDQRTQEGQDQPAGRPQTFGPSVRAVE